MRDDNDINDMMEQLQRQMNSYDAGRDDHMDRKRSPDQESIRDEYARYQKERNDARDKKLSHERRRKRRKKPLYIGLIVAAAIFAAAAGIWRVTESGELFGIRAKKDWSVLIYFCGADLETEGGCATNQIREILTADLKNVNVIIETGGAEEWQYDGIDSSKHQRFEVSDHELKEVDSEETRSMGDPDTLGDFLKWGVRHYPAKKYAAVLWDHGGGSLGGICYDEQYETDSQKDHLTLPELSQAFRKSGGNFNVIFLDACLMATLETAEAVEPYADYLVASEESEPGIAHFYRSWLEDLSEDPDMSGRQLGKNITNSYYESCIEISDSNNVQYARTAMLGTMSVMDLSKVPDILAAFSDINNVMKQSVNDPDTFGQIVRGANQAKSFANPEFGMVDMYDLVEKISPAVKSASPDAIYQAIDNAVVYQKKGILCSDVHGIAVFYPKKDQSTDPEMTKAQIELYSEISSNQPYIDFMYSTDYANWTDNYHGDDTIDDSNGNRKWSYSERLNSSGQLELTVENPEYLEIVYDQMLTAEQTSDGNSVVISLGQMINKNIAVDSSGESEVFQSQFDGTWTEIDGIPVSVVTTAINDEENYVLMEIPAEVNEETGLIEAAYLQDTGQYQILGWHRITDDGVSDRVETIPDGAGVQFLYEGYQEENTVEARSSEITYHTGSTAMDHAYRLGTGAYTYQFFMRDIYGNEKTTDGATFTVRSDGKLTSELNS